MNSLSCVLSYNYYDYKALLKDKDGKVSFEDFQATVSIADICDRDAFR